MKRRKEISTKSSGKSREKEKKIDDLFIINIDVNGK